MKRKIFLLLIVIFGIFLCTRSITLAKYASNSVWNYYLKSQGFYFESDNLIENGKNNVNTLWDGNRININVRNNLNQSLISDFDIEYEVNCEVVGTESSNLTCLVNGKDKYTGILSSSQACVSMENIDTSSLTKTECELEGYTWQQQVATNDLYFEVRKNSENYEMNDVTVKVYATSISPYRKTLEATYKLHYALDKTGEIIKKYDNYDNYNRLTITNTYDTDKCVSVSFDGTNKVIDIENDKISTDELGNVNKVTFLLPSKKSLSYIVYGQTTDDFNLQIESSCN